MYWPHFLGLFTLHNGTCVTETCPAPTITGVEWRKVSFVLNWADANATMLIKTEDNENWPSWWDVSGTSSPRSLGSTPAKWYTKMRTLCKNGVWSTDSNVVEFETQMIIDSIEGCALKYHFDGNDPISGKSCCNPVRLDYSYDGVTFSPLTTTYKNWMSFASHWKEWKVYFRYSLDWWKSWSSTTSYNMSKQSCGSSSCSRTFYDGTPLNWVANWLYAEDWYKLAEISYWSAATANNAWYNTPCRPITNNSNCTYNTHRRTLDSVTTYDCPDRTFYLSINDSATLYNAYRNHYNNTPTDKTIIYVPGMDNNWCKLEMRIASANDWWATWFNFYVDGVASHVWNLCR